MGENDTRRRRAAADLDQLTRSLDVALNGERGAAPQASLVDVVGQAQHMARILGGPIAEVATLEHAAAERTLRHLRYTYTDGAELWKPPIGPVPNFDIAGVERIAHERRRQYEIENFGAEQDDTYIGEQLPLAGAWYATPSIVRRAMLGCGFDFWPWPRDMFKPDDTGSTEGRIRELAKAGALIAAEIDRLKRAGR